MVQLSINSISDLKTRTIRPVPTVLCGIAGLVLPCLMGKPLSLPSLLIRVLPSCLLLLISVLSKGAVGAGDAFALLSLGAGIPFDRQLSTLVLTSAFLFIYAAFRFLKSKNKRESLPMIPFLLAGYIASLILF